MAKNLGREFAAMTEDERRRFAMKPEDSGDDTPEEVNLEEPRGDDQEDPRPRKER